VSYLRLPHDVPEGPHRYGMPDPDACADAFVIAYRHRYCGERAPSPIEVGKLLQLADGYLTLTTYALGQECCVRKLRDIWRARRSQKRGGS
jgi:hypothetical protein